jgi:hypothetical protein
LIYFNIFLFIYSNCILHPYGSSNYNTKAYKHIKEKQHKHNKYVNVGEIFDWRGPYREISSSTLHYCLLVGLVTSI